MTINFKLKNLIVIALFINFSSFAENNHTAEATAAETKMKFWDLPLLKEAFINTAPAERNDTIVVGKLGTDGGNKAMVLQLAQEFANNKHGDYDSLLITYKDKFLFESYFMRGRINLPHFQSSATKGYTSLLLSRAIQLGYITMADLDKPLVGFLKGLDHEKFVDGVKKITLHQALTMRSGLRFSEEQVKNFRENPEQFKGLAQVQAFLEQSEPINSESQSYQYRGFGPIIVMNVLDAVVPGSAKDFIKNEFFGKLSITNYQWRDDKSSLPMGEGGLNLTSRDMLKLGMLIINEGKWNGEQLLSSDYLAKATSAITRANEDWQGPETYFYGYLWYQTNLTSGDKSYDVKVAWGAGGNRIILIDELDLVVAVTGHDLVDETMMTQISKFILPAFVK
jgi:hypothetical protein